MYSLVIAEDELATRRGLVNMIKWDELGFQVDGVFSDGKDVIEYLSNHNPDVILTDIQMCQVTGVEVARFVAEQNLPVQVVFLTAYREFTFAQFAVEYHVAHYLLKPISVPKLREVFHTLREKLDKQSVLENALQNRMDHYSQLINYEKQQFVTAVYFGSLTNEMQMKERLKLLNANNADVYLVEILLNNSPRYASFVANYGMQELQEQLIHIQESYDQRYEYYPIIWHTIKRTGGLSVLGVLWEKDNTEHGAAELVPERAKAQLCDVIAELTDVAAEIPTFRKLKSAVELVHCMDRIGENEPVEKLTQDIQYLQLLRDQKKLLYSYICQEDFEQVTELAHTFLNNCLRCGVAFTQRQLLHTVTKIIDRMADSDLAEWNRLYMRCMTPQVFSVLQLEELDNWLVSRLRMLFDFSCAQAKTKEDSSIRKVMHYIQDHYAEDLTLTDIAEKVYLNPVYISRLIKEQTGKNYTDLVMELRVAHAVQLLENTDLYVYEIAEQVGYHNLKYFYKVFRKIKGCSPSDYRPAAKKGITRS